MEPTLPTGLADYCKVNNISFFDLKLPCIFCNFLVELQELADFYCKKLSLVYRNKKCYACCRKCLRLSALFEKENYFQCTVPAAIVEDLVNQNLKDIAIRCMYCVKLLDYLEKLDIYYRGGVFYLVRSKWKGCCRNCMIEQ